MSQPAVCTATVADIKDDDFLLRVMHSIYDPIVPPHGAGRDTLSRSICAHQTAGASRRGLSILWRMRIMRGRGNAAISFSTLALTRDLRTRPLLFVSLPELAEFYGRFFAPLRYNSKVVKVFQELFVLLQKITATRFPCSSMMECSPGAPICFSLSGGTINLRLLHPGPNLQSRDGLCPVLSRQTLSRSSPAGPPLFLVWMRMCVHFSLDPKSRRIFRDYGTTQDTFYSSKDILISV